MSIFASKDDITAINNAMPYEDRDRPATMYAFMKDVKDRFGSRPAISYQIFSGPKDAAETLTWDEFFARSVQAANLFRSLGVGEKDAVAFVLPNCNETAATVIGGMIAGIVNPVNPLLDATQIGAILRETKAKVVVTLKAFPKTDVAQKTAEAVALAPNVEHVIEVDLLRYVTGVKKMIIPLIRPKNPVTHNAKVHQWDAAVGAQSTTLDFADSEGDRVAAYFHTGGTTGMPKVAQHRYSGMIYNGWIGDTLLFTEEDNVICPLPMFHVFAVHVIMMAMISSGAHVVFPTPQGYRGDGVFDNFWKLIERWQITFVITVPTAISALMQRPVDADISSIKTAFSGSSPLPLELFKKFEGATGVNIVEGYGLTEATCLVSCNPVGGLKKVGSVGLPLPYTDVKILMDTADGPKEMGVDEIGEVCVDNHGVYAGNTYTEAEKNQNLYHFDTYLRTGDLGRIDEDGYLWITGRAKDLIIRGGHNIDPAEIEEALAGHDAVAMVGAIGQPDAHSGELPCAYVELVQGASVSVDELMEYAKANIHERAAFPKYIEVLDELPKTAVGKVFKPDLRKSAITRIYDKALSDAGLAVRVAEVQDNKKQGLLAMLTPVEGVSDAQVTDVLGSFTRPWQWAD
ncbi:MAG: acyl-CoA synthetase [Nereida ignava]|uniref:acyl-CoA synthetase n=1 Tax=Nereida ignava TaxID=282199 RepID=UPI0030FC2A1B